MLRKSVETRDWLNTIEPRNVRAVMKRVVEDVTAIDTQVGQLYEEGVRKERSSDSSRRTFNHSQASRQQPKSQWSYTPRYVRHCVGSIIGRKKVTFSAIKSLLFNGSYSNFIQYSLKIEHIFCQV